MLVSEAEFNKLLDTVADSLRGSLEEGSVFVGVQRRGVVIAKRIADRIEKSSGLRLPVGMVDITLYRDDLSTSPPQPILHSTELPFDVNGRSIVLVDDVIFTGRTIRAALSALLDFGRPSVVRLLVIVDRGNRELPIQPDFLGMRVETSRDDIVEVLVKELDGRDGVRLLKGGVEA